MEDKGKSILIVTRSERWREAVHALLTSVINVDGISSADGISSVLQAMIEQAPGLVLLDASLSDDEIQAVLRQIKAERFETGCIVLANSAQQKRVAIEAGADAVLFRGRSTADLLTAIARLLPTPKRCLGVGNYQLPIRCRLP